MKISLDFNTFKNICLSMAEEISKYEPNEIIAISRGGLSAAHIIAKYLNLNVGMYFPKEKQLLMSSNKYLSKVVFVEDLVAHGRTFDLLNSHMLELGFTSQTFEWKFAPVLIDGKYIETQDFNDKLITYGLKTNHWIVMPYEEETKMVEGDRGLFRDNTDQYGG